MKHLADERSGKGPGPWTTPLKQPVLRASPMASYSLPQLQLRSAPIPHRPSQKLQFCNQHPSGRPQTLGTFGLDVLWTKPRWVTQLAKGSLRQPATCAIQGV